MDSNTVKAFQIISKALHTISAQLVELSTNIEDCLPQETTTGELIEVNLPSPQTVSSDAPAQPKAAKKKIKKAKAATEGARKTRSNKKK